MLDEWLRVQEGKVVEVMEEVTKGRSEALHRSMELSGRMEGMETIIGGMDESLKEIRALLLGLLFNKKDGEILRPTNAESSLGQSLRFGSILDTGGLFNPTIFIATPSSTP